ncbi:MAG: dCTP deaminase [Thermoplasmata archaeon]
MILSDGTILDLIQAGTLDIKPFNIERLTPNGYDFGIDEDVSIPPGTGKQIETSEAVFMPDFIGAMMFLRSSYSRRGLIASFGYVDAGFRGKIRFFVYNSGQEEIKLTKEKGVFQMIFMNLDKQALKNYESRSGHYQNQGIK